MNNAAAQLIFVIARPKEPAPEEWVVVEEPKLLPAHVPPPTHSKYGDRKVVDVWLEEYDAKWGARKKRACQRKKLRSMGYNRLNMALAYWPEEKIQDELGISKAQLDAKVYWMGVNDVMSANERWFNKHGKKRRYGDPLPLGRCEDTFDDPPCIAARRTPTGE